MAVLTRTSLRSPSSSCAWFSGPRGFSAGAASWIGYDGKRSYRPDACTGKDLMRLDKVTCIEDLRQIHKRRVPKAFFDYLDRGSYSEETYRANLDDFKKLKLRQRVLMDVADRDLS